MGRIKNSVKSAAISIIQFGFFETLESTEAIDFDGVYTADDVKDAYDWICKKVGL
tara:strand:- start:149 stop:313 length:165 start_codon:yes stop_codon:yes gene_type:complete